MAGYELLSDQGLRLDGRRSCELRRIRCKVGVFGQADGSAYFEQVKPSMHERICPLASRILEIRIHTI